MIEQREREGQLEVNRLGRRSITVNDRYIRHYCACETFRIISKLHFLFIC
jgi:hypothetical protein